MSSFAVVLDACVLYPAALVDLLLRAAAQGLYRPYWSIDILRELERNLAKRVGEGPAARRVAAMRAEFADAEVVGYAALVDSMTNHPKDRHVVAAAVQAGAQVIVTNNVRDFPEPALTPYQLEVQTSDEFLLLLFDLKPDVIVHLMQRQAAALRDPPLLFDDVLRHLSKHAPYFVARVRGQKA